MNKKYDISLSGKIILHVKDELLIQIHIKEVLENYGASVINAASVQECINIIDSAIKFDLIILDINLEDGSGFEILDKIVKERISAKVIVCTSYVFINDIGKSIGQFGVVATLEKPFDPDDAALESYKAIKEGRYVCDEHNSSEIRRLENEVQRKIRSLASSVDQIIVEILGNAKIKRKKKLGFFKWRYVYEIDSETVKSIRVIEDLRGNLEKLLESAENDKGNYSWYLMARKILTPQIKETIIKTRDAAISEIVKSILN